MKITSDKLSANAAAIHSMLSDGRQGLLGLSVPPSIFNTIPNIHFTRPVNPNPRPIMPTNSDARSVLFAQKIRTEALSQLKEVEDSDQVLKHTHSAKLRRKNITKT